jgi:hypothetical protein
VDPADRTGPTVNRPQSRVVEYALDLQTHEARVAWSHSIPGRYAYFAGSARRLGNGNTLIGWAALTTALASEVGPDGTMLWELAAGNQFLSYRAWKADVPDTVAPVVRLGAPADGAVLGLGQQVRPDPTCTDRGGSSLQTCVASRGPLDTGTPGRHEYVVTATDGAGNSTRVTRTYTVAAAPVARASVTLQSAGSTVIRRRGGTSTSVVRLRNAGTAADDLRVRGTGGDARFRVAYRASGRDVTPAVLAGTWHTGTLAAGASRYLTMRVTRLHRTRDGAARPVSLSATPVHGGPAGHMIRTFRAR